MHLCAGRCAPIFAQRCIALAAPERGVIWAVLAFAPPIVMSLAMTAIFQNPNYAPPLAVKGTVWGGYWWSIIGGVSFLITLLFMACALFNQNIDTGKKVLWTALLFLGSIWALPFYWWFHLREAS